MERLVVSVDVEKDGVQDTSLFSPSATLIVQLHIGLSTLDSIFLITLHNGSVLSYVVEFL